MTALELILYCALSFIVGMVFAFLIDVFDGGKVAAWIKDKIKIK